MKVQHWKRILIFGMAASLVACSSSKTKENQGNDVIPAAIDAGTDALPQPVAELPPPEQPNLSTPSSDAVASETPSPPTQSSSASEGLGNDYSVKAGDTLMKIAFDTYGDIYKWKEIYEANKEKIKDPNVIPEGLVLRLDQPSNTPSLEKNGEKYEIKQGDTLGSISHTLYGTESKWKALWENNKHLIHDPNKIFAGFYLYYSSEGVTPPQATSSSTSSPSTSNPSSVPLASPEKPLGDQLGGGLPPSAGAAVPPLGSNLGPDTSLAPAAPLSDSSITSPAPGVDAPIDPGSQK